jgi:hypothetical protein
MDLWMTLAAVAIATLLIVAANQAQAQTLQILHNFTDGGTEPIHRVASPSAAEDNSMAPPTPVESSMTEGSEWYSECRR